MATHFLKSIDATDRFERGAGEIEDLLDRPGGAPRKPNRAGRLAARPRGRHHGTLLHSGWLGIAIASMLVGMRLGPRDSAGPGPVLPESGRETPPPAAPAASRPALTALATGERGVDTGRGGGLVSPPGPGWAGSDSDLSAADMQHAAESLLARGGDPLQRELLFPQLLARLTPGNAIGMWDALKESDWGNEGTHRIAIFAQVWGKLDGPAALAARDGGGRWRALFGMRALKGWSEQEPERALAWANGEQSAMTKPLRVALLKGLAKSNPDAAAEYLATLGGRTDPGTYVAPVVAALLEERLEDAESWVATLPSGQLRASGLEQLAKHLAKEDVGRASEWVAEYAADTAGTKAMATVAEALIDQSFSPGGDRERAVGWLESLPEGEPKNAAYATAFGTWARRNVDQAGTYLGQLPDSPAKDQAVRAFALEVSDKDPEAAVLWANIIGDPEDRQRTLYTTARRWYREDEGRSSAWLAEAGLPDELVQQITEP